MRSSEIISSIDWHPEISVERRREIEDAIIALDRKSNIRLLSEVEMTGRIMRDYRAAGSGVAWGRRMGVGKSFAHDVLSAKRSPTPAILAKLGLRRRTFYEEI
jgi:hypothetical protein